MGKLLPNLGIQAWRFIYHCQGHLQGSTHEVDVVRMEDYQAIGPGHSRDSESLRHQNPLPRSRFSVDDEVTKRSGFGGASPSRQ